MGASMKIGNMTLILYRIPNYTAEMSFQIYMAGELPCTNLLRSLSKKSEKKKISKIISGSE